MSILNKPYTLSLVQDFFTISGEQEGIDDISAQEQILMKIGSNTMTTPSRAFEPELVEKTNGEVILSFKMYYRYYDELTGEEVENQLCKYLINERKVNLDYNNKTYQFLIRNVEEDSENKIFSYQLKDASVIELSKSGFELVLDNELMNNSGTIAELGDRVLEGSRWKVDKEKSDIIVQTIDEALYEYTLEEDINAIQISDPVYRDGKYQGCSIGNSVNIASGTKIYIFASSYNDKPYRFQFIYTEEEIKKDDNRIILNENCQYYIDNYDYPAKLETAEVSIEYRGRRYVFSQMSLYIPNLNRYVYSYADVNDKDNTYYGFIDTEFVSPQIIQNYVSNNTFKSSAGWHGGWFSTGAPAENADKDTKTGKCEAVAARLKNNNVVTLINDISNGAYKVETEYTPILKMEFQGNESIVVNNGFYDYRDKFPHGIRKYETYVVRLKPFGKIISNLRLQIRELSYNTNRGGYYSSKKSEEADLVFDIVQFNNEPGSNGYYNIKCKAKKDLTAQEISQRKINFVFFADEGEFYLQDFQVFPYVDNGENGFIIPEEQEVTTKIIDHYYVNTLDKLQKAESINDLVPVHSETRNPGDKQLEIISENYIPKYNETAEKIRTISLKESNRFNGIQLLAETFESWPELDSANKKIIFHKYVGTDNYSGFRYGVNLKQIKRTIDSNEIVTKLIVKDNVNELANNGFCSIGKASSNELRGNVIYNFQYYINKGLLDPVIHQKVLYGKNGIFNVIAETNKEIDKFNEDLLPNFESLVQINSKIILYENTVKAAESDFENTSAALENETGLTLSGLANQNNKDELSKSSVIVNYLKQLSEYKATLDEYIKKLEQAKIQKETLQNRITDLEDAIQKQKDIKAAAELKFSELMSAFIQEGTWHDEKYINDELYYIDAQSVMYNSSLPKVSYTIDVLELSQLPGYDMFNFGLGDRTFIEDPEYFGYNEDGSCYRESIVITERKSNLDQPDKNTIKVQNYKTQFQDLFQRITATVQSVQYSEGSYDKAAALAEADVVEKVKFLQEALNDASLILQNAGDQSVLVDINGITITDVDQPSEKIRLIGGGIFLSQSMEDGTQKWTTAITAKGINASVITAGQINTAVVQIMNGTEPTFRWDAFGLTAYEFGTGLNDSYIWDINTKKGVRFDRFGIYGFHGPDGLIWHPNSLQEIDENSTFSLTWGGLKVTGTNKTVATIGRHSIGNNSYIMRVVNGEGNETFSITNNGTVTAEIANFKLANIGGWVIEDAFLRSDDYKIYLAPNGVDDAISGNEETWVIKAGENFGVTPEGRVVTKKGNIAGWNISKGELTCPTTEFYTIGLFSGQEYCFTSLQNNSTTSPVRFGLLSHWLTTGKTRFDLYSDTTEYTISINTSSSCEDDFKITQSNLSFDTLPSGWVLDSITNEVQPNEIILYLKFQSSGESGQAVINGIMYPTKDKTLANTSGFPNFAVLADGSLYAKRAKIEGTIYANDGVFKGDVYADDGIFKGQVAAKRISFKQLSADIGEFELGCIPNSSTTTTGVTQYFKFQPSTQETPSAIQLEGDTYQFNGQLKLRVTTSDGSQIFIILDSAQAMTIGAKMLAWYFWPTSNPQESNIIDTLYNSGGGTIYLQPTLIDSKGTQGDTVIKTFGSGKLQLSYKIQCNNFTTTGTGLVVGASVVPYVSATCDLGSTTFKWNRIYSSSTDSNSDRRLKENFMAFSKEYDSFFDELKPLHYNFISDATDKKVIRFGYIAQDIESNINAHLLTNSCSYDILHKELKADGEYYYGLNYNEFIALNTWQIQLLKPRMTAVEEEIISLKSEIAELRQVIENLQNNENSDII